MPVRLLSRINYVSLLVSSQMGYAFVLGENESQISAVPPPAPSAHPSLDWKPFSVGRGVGVGVGGCCKSHQSLLIVKLFQAPLC